MAMNAMSLLAKASILQHGTGIAESGVCEKKSVDAPVRFAMHPPVPPKFQCCHMTHMDTTTKADFFFAAAWHSTNPTATTLKFGGKGAER